MAGRGAHIVIRLVAQSAELALDVGLHTPLGILKEQLAVQTGIQVKQQVLMLLDLSTPEARHWHDPNDIILEEDFRTLRELGIQKGSVLSLHSIAAPVKKADDADGDAASGAAKAPEALTKVSQMEVKTLATSVAPKDADHSFSGVIWDLEARGPYELCVTSVSVGGMLGRVRVFARESSWRGANGEARLINTHWGTQRVDLDPNGWVSIADELCAPSWDTPREIKFRKPLIIPPHTKRALFVHSNLPDDLGIQYQSYYRDSVIAEDDHLRMLPGLGFTGNVPFDERRGWYRAYRGPAGTVSYTARLKTWEPRLHAQFPVEMRAAVRTMLCSNGARETLALGGALPHVPRSHCRSRFALPSSCANHNAEGKRPPFPEASFFCAILLPLRSSQGVGAGAAPEGHCAAHPRVLPPRLVRGGRGCRRGRGGGGGGGGGRGAVDAHEELMTDDEEESEEGYDSELEGIMYF